MKLADAPARPSRETPATGTCRPGRSMHIGRCASRTPSEEGLRAARTGTAFRRQNQRRPGHRHSGDMYNDSNHPGNLGAFPRIDGPGMHDMRNTNPSPLCPPQADDCMPRSLSRKHDMEACRTHGRWETDPPHNRAVRRSELMRYPPPQDAPQDIIMKPADAPARSSREAPATGTCRPGRSTRIGRCASRTPSEEGLRATYAGTAFRRQNLRRPGHRHSGDMYNDSNHPGNLGAFPRVDGPGTHDRRSTNPSPLCLPQAGDCMPRGPRRAGSPHARKLTGGVARHDVKHAHLEHEHVHHERKIIFLCAEAIPPLDGLRTRSTRIDRCASRTPNEKGRWPARAGTAFRRLNQRRPGHRHSGDMYNDSNHPGGLGAFPRVDGPGMHDRRSTNPSPLCLPQADDCVPRCPRHAGSPHARKLTGGMARHGVKHAHLEYERDHHERKIIVLCAEAIPPLDGLRTRSTRIGHCASRTLSKEGLRATYAGTAFRRQNLRRPGHRHSGDMYNGSNHPGNLGAFPRVDGPGMHDRRSTNPSPLCLPQAGDCTPRGPRRAGSPHARKLTGGVARHGVKHAHLEHEHVHHERKIIVLCAEAIPPLDGLRTRSTRIDRCASRTPNEKGRWPARAGTAFRRQNQRRPGHRHSGDMYNDSNHPGGLGAFPRVDGPGMHDRRSTNPSPLCLPQADDCVPRGPRHAGSPHARKLTGGVARHGVKHAHLEYERDHHERKIIVLCAEAIPPLDGLRTRSTRIGHCASRTLSKEGLRDARPGTAFRRQNQRRPGHRHSGDMYNDSNHPCNLGAFPRVDGPGMHDRRSTYPSPLCLPQVDDCMPRGPRRAGSPHARKLTGGVARHGVKHAHLEHEHVHHERKIITLCTEAIPPLDGLRTRSTRIGRCASRTPNKEGLRTARAGTAFRRQNQRRPGHRPTTACRAAPATPAPRTRASSQGGWPGTVSSMRISNHERKIIVLCAEAIPPQIAAQRPLAGTHCTDTDGLV